VRMRNLLPAVAPCAAVLAALVLIGPGVGSGQAGKPPGSCAVAYRVTDEWSGGFESAVTVINTGAAAINGWSLMWTFPNGQTTLRVWDGVATSDGSTVTVRSTPDNAPLPPAATAMFGFTGAAGSRNAPPDEFTLNGVHCAVA
jgi:cellulase/cellobiase CelA1